MTSPEDGLLAENEIVLGLADFVALSVGLPTRRHRTGGAGKSFRDGDDKA